MCRGQFCLTHRSAAPSLCISIYYSHPRCIWPISRLSHLLWFVVMQFDSLGVLTVWKEIKSQEEVWFMNSSADSDQRKQTVDVKNALRYKRCLAAIRVCDPCVTCLILNSVPRDSGWKFEVVIKGNFEGFPNEKESKTTNMLEATRL